LSPQKEAKKILLEKRDFIDLTNSQKKNLLIAFAKKGKAVQKTAFDLVRAPSNVDFSNQNSIEKNLNSITLIEIKSTEGGFDEQFHGYFFGITMTELLLAQSHRKQYRFIFVNVNTKKTMEMDISQVLSRIKNLHLVLHTTI